MSNRAGMLLVLAGPSGAGKTTLARRLVSEVPEFEFSVSTTTRPPRGGEKEGLDYDFVTDDEFDELVREGFFLEWARVHGYRYGTSRSWVEKTLAAGRSVILDIDVVGARNVRAAIPGAVLVFVLPPSAGVLAGRLEGRGTESGENLARRMSAASIEMRWIGAFDFVVENDGLHEASRRLLSIVEAEASRTGGIPYPSAARALDPSMPPPVSWEGRRVLIASGPTREYIDDVRFLSNRSSGVMGCELASAFRAAGASVTLLLGPCRAAPPRAVTLERFTDSSGLSALLHDLAPGHDLLAMPAAVADFRPVRRMDGKLPRSGGGMTLELEQVEDISASVSGLCPLLSFSLEFGDRDIALERARRKMSSKGAFASFLNFGDLPGSGMDSDADSGVLIRAGREDVEIPEGSKRFVAEMIVSSLGRPPSRGV